MNRFLLAAFLALAFFASSSRADPITVICSATAGSGGSYCPVSDGGEPFLAGATAAPVYGAVAYDDLQETVQVEFTAGPASLLGGYFVPCLTILPEPGLGAAYLTAQFGTASIWGIADSGTCPMGQGTPSYDEIPFTFGVQSTYQLDLYAASYYGAHTGGTALALFENLEIFDSAGNPITATVTYSVFTPEPPPALILFPTAVCCAIISLRRKRR